MQLVPIPAFTDNYIWLLHDGVRALVVDPGEAPGVQAWLAGHRIALDTILITHHHADHTGGVAALREATGARVIGPVVEPMPEPLQRVGAGDEVEVLGLRFAVMEVPGHTAGHIAYVQEGAAPRPLLFCGDTLFSGGCGRIFEGTPAQMLDALDRLSLLPGRTRVCPAHEYTLSNLKFALTIDPDNSALQTHQRLCAELRQQEQPTLPVHLSIELDINPFLRSRSQAVAAAVKRHDASAVDDVSTFAALRTWKNEFK